MIPPEARTERSNAPATPEGLSPVAMLAAGTPLGLLFLTIDAAWRDAWGRSVLGHFAAALPLLVGWTTAVAAVLALLVAVGSAVLRRWTSAHTRRRTLVHSLGFGALAAAASAPMAVSLFSGPRVSTSPYAPLGSIGLTLVLLLGSAGAIYVGTTARRRGGAAWTAVSLTYLVSAAVLLAIDQTVLVSLYEALHAWLQLAASTVLVLLFAARIGPRLRSRRGAAATLWAPGLLSACLLPFPSVQAWRETALGHTFEAPGYAGRALRQTQRALVWVQDPRSAARASSSFELAVQRLAARYGITDTALDERWTHPPPLFGPPRGPPPRPDIVLFYVDTLRADVAYDPRVMPSVAMLRAGGWTYERVYAAGSDTISSVPSIWTGRYLPGAADVSTFTLEGAAARTGYDAELIIGRGSAEYLSERIPALRFPRTVVVDDYVDDGRPWDLRPGLFSAPAIVDHAIEALRAPRSRPLLLWLFHTDQHVWQQLDEAQLRRVARDAGLSSTGGRSWKYAATARTVDQQLGRLMQEVRERSARRPTVVVFLADHGEALGRNGYFAHAVFLWEELVRVPLVIAGGGLGSGRVERPVSLVDLAPTLATLMGVDVDARWFHGENLLALPHQRRLPIVMASYGARRHPLRIGVIDAAGTHKLVANLESVRLEYHSLLDPDPDARDGAPENEEPCRDLLRQVLQSPLLPR